MNQAIILMALRSFGRVGELAVFREADARKTAVLPLIQHEGIDEDAAALLESVRAERLLAGGTGLSRNNVSGGGAGLPKWQINSLVTYAIGSLSLSREGRFIDELFVGVQNLLDHDPPVAPSNQGSTNMILFEPLGRAYRAGVRVDF